MNTDENMFIWYNNIKILTVAALRSQCTFLKQENTFHSLWLVFLIKHKLWFLELTETDNNPNDQWMMKHTYILLHVYFDTQLNKCTEYFE